MRRLLRRIRSSWWVFWNRCSICGDKRPKFNVSDVHTRGPYCRPHNKMMLFGMMYGANPNRLKRSVDEETAQVREVLGEMRRVFSQQGQDTGVWIDGEHLTVTGRKPSEPQFQNLPPKKDVR